MLCNPIFNVYGSLRSRKGEETQQRAPDVPFGLIRFPSFFRSFSWRAKVSIDTKELEESWMSDGGREGRRCELGRGDGDCISISWVGGITCVSSVSGEAIYLDLVLLMKNLVEAHKVTHMRRRGVWMTPIFDYVVAFPLIFMHRDGQYPFVSSDTNRDHSTAAVAPG